MITQAEVTAKIASLKAYSVSQEALTEPLFSPLEAAVSAYYNGNRADVSLACEDVVKYMYNDISRRTTVYEHAEYDPQLPTDYPTGYNDITKCFADASAIAAITEAAFYDAFVFGPDPLTSVTVPLSNGYIDDWTARLTAAVTGDLAQVKALAEWCKNSGGSSDLIDLLEDRGDIVAELSREEIAELIYKTRGLLSVIDALGLTTYIPSYLRGGS